MRNLLHYLFFCIVFFHTENFQSNFQNNKDFNETSIHKSISENNNTDINQGTYQDNNNNQIEDKKQETKNLQILKNKLILMLQDSYNILTKHGIKIFIFTFLFIILSYIVIKKHKKHTEKKQEEEQKQEEEGQQELQRQEQERKNKDEKSAIQDRLKQINEEQEKFKKQQEEERLERAQRLEIERQEREKQQEEERLKKLYEKQQEEERLKKLYEEEQEEEERLRKSFEKEQEERIRRVEENKRIIKEEQEQEYRRIQQEREEAEIKRKQEEAEYKRIIEEEEKKRLEEERQELQRQEALQRQRLEEEKQRLEEEKQKKERIRIQEELQRMRLAEQEEDKRKKEEIRRLEIEILEAKRLKIEKNAESVLENQQTETLKLIEGYKKYYKEEIEEIKNISTEIQKSLMQRYQEEFDEIKEKITNIIIEKNQSSDRINEQLNEEIQEIFELKKTLNDLCNKKKNQIESLTNYIQKYGKVKIAKDITRAITDNIVKYFYYNKEKQHKNNKQHEDNKKAGNNCDCDKIFDGFKITNKKKTDDESKLILIQEAQKKLIQIVDQKDKKIIQLKQNAQIEKMISDITLCSQEWYEILINAIDNYFKHRIDTSFKKEPLYDKDGKVNNRHIFSKIEAILDCLNKQPMANDFLYDSYIKFNGCGSNMTLSERIYSAEDNQKTKTISLYLDRVEKDNQGSDSEVQNKLSISEDLYKELFNYNCYEQIKTIFNFDYLITKKDIKKGRKRGIEAVCDLFEYKYEYLNNEYLNRTSYLDNIKLKKDTKYIIDFFFRLNNSDKAEFNYKKQQQLNDITPEDLFNLFKQEKLLDENDEKYKHYKFIDIIIDKEKTEEGIKEENVKGLISLENKNISLYWMIYLISITKLKDEDDDDDEDEANNNENKKVKKDSLIQDIVNKFNNTDNQKDIKQITKGMHSLKERLYTNCLQEDHNKFRKMYYIIEQNYEVYQNQTQQLGAIQ